MGIVAAADKITPLFLDKVQIGCGKSKGDSIPELGMTVVPVVAKQTSCYFLTVLFFKSSTLSRVAP